MRNDKSVRCVCLSNVVVADLLSTMCSGVTPSCPPHLGIVLYLLNTSSHQFAVTMDAYKQQHLKYTNLADLSADEIKQARFCPPAFICDVKNTACHFILH